MKKLINLYTRFKSWFFEVHELENIKRSRWHHLTEKLPLLMVMYASSVLIGISTFTTFPMIFDPIMGINIVGAVYEFLRVSVSIIGGAAFDVIVTATVFSLRKNMLSYCTVGSALVVGLLIALDLYLGWHQQWMHALYILMGVLFALHLATTRGRTVDELETSNLELSRTNEELSRTNAELLANSEELPSIKDELDRTKNQLENFKEVMLEKLATKTDLTANEIISLVGGTRAIMLAKIKEYRKEE